MPKSKQPTERYWVQVPQELHWDLQKRWVAAVLRQDVTPTLTRIS